MTKRWVKPDRESPSPAHYTLASTFRQTQSTSQLSARESQSSIRSLSHLQSAEKKRQLPGPSHYSTSNFTKLASYRQPPKFTIKRAKTTERPSRQQQPDMNSYSFDFKPQSSFLIHRPTKHPSVSTEFFEREKMIRSRVGPQSYEVTPNLAKPRINCSKDVFPKATRRFKFNQRVEAVDRVITSCKSTKEFS